MAHSGEEPLGKKVPSEKSLHELMELLLKLNDQLRQKIPARRKKEEPGDMEMVIIILNSSSERVPRASRTEKPKPMKNDWIDDLCEEIEGRSGGRKNSA